MLMKEEKQDLRKLSKGEREQIRRNAYKLFKGGWNHCAIARELGLTQSMVYNWVKRFREEGFKGIEEKSRGGLKGKRKILGSEIEKQIKQDVVDKTPDQLKMKFCLWNSQAIRQHIMQNYKLKIAARTVRLYMKRWGFTPQRAKKRAYEQRPEEVKEWIEQQYPLIQQRAKQEGGEIYWADETGVNSHEHFARGYSPKGQTPVLTMSGSARTRINMISAITNQGKLRFMIYKGTMDSTRMISFLKRLIQDAQKKVFLIVDNLKVHHSKKVTAWVEEHEQEIELHYLPRYAPEHNPDEYLNNDLKTALNQREPSRTKKEMKNKIRSHMMRSQRNPSKIRRFFRHPKVKYAS